MKRKPLALTFILAILVTIMVGIPVVNWYHSSLKIDDSWVANVTQFLEEAKPYPEWNDEYTLHGHNLWLSENGSDQFIGAPSSPNNFTDFLRMLLSKVNTQIKASIDGPNVDNMLKTNRVLKVQFRLGCNFPPLNTFVWTAYFVLDDGSNQGLKGTIFVDRDGNNGSGNWSSWAITPFPTTLIIATSVTVAVIGVGLLVYFKKRKH
jgi:hypothetical protein